MHLGVLIISYDGFRWGYCIILYIRLLKYKRNTIINKAKDVINVTEKQPKNRIANDHHLQTIAPITLLT